jgi:hypothetical protein
VRGIKRNGAVFSSEFEVYTPSEFLTEFKNSENTMTVPTITHANEDGVDEELCLVRSNKRRKLTWFSEESTDLIEQVLQHEWREGQAKDKYKALAPVGVASRPAACRAAGRLTVKTFAQLQSEAAKIEKERLLRESGGGAPGFVSE